MQKHLSKAGPNGGIQIKICGLTQPQTAEYCLGLNVQAVGLVFFPPSPRHVSVSTARQICEAVGDRVAKVGVFVNPQFGTVMDTVTNCGLTVVQLHGQEPPALVDRLRQNGVRVIKALFASRNPGFNRASRYRPDAFLVECGQGTLPGGNAQQWDWRSARPLTDHHKVLLAGGLSAENVAAAIKQARPAAVDVSSGVEETPGAKDHSKIAAFVNTVRQSPNRPSVPGSVFN